MRGSLRKPLPTDLQILEEIYGRYYDQFAAFDGRETESQEVKIMVPIDIVKVAEALNVDGDVVFGRLYYYLQKKHGYTKTDRNGDVSEVTFFSMVAGKHKHCVNFPMLGSVLAGLREEDTKARTATRLAVASLIVSAVSLTASIAMAAMGGL